MRRIAFIVLACLLAGFFVSPAFSNGQQESGSEAEVWEDPNPDPFSPMPFPVVFTTGRHLPLEMNLPEGEELDETDFHAWVEENVNVTSDIIWTTSDQGSAYRDKINILIASNDIPDAFTLNVENQNAFSILRKLVENDLIMDLSEVWDEYASDSFKTMHAIADNVALDAVSYDGGMWAIPNIADIETAVPVVWVRQDWLDELGLDGPETLDDVEEIGRAFMEDDPDGNDLDDTEGLLGSIDMFRKDTNSFDYVFSAYDVYPGDWIRRDDGRVVYGSVQPGVKDALGRLREWYAEGLLDEEFALKDSGQATEPIMANQAGIFQGAWWSAWWPIMSSVQNDPEAQWRPYFIQGQDGDYHFRSFPVSRELVVIRKGYEYPQAIMKVLNHYQAAELIEPDYEWASELRTGKYAEASVGLWPINGVAAKYIDEISRRAAEVTAIVGGELDPEEATAAGTAIAGQIEAFEESGEVGTGDWAQWLNWTFAASSLNDIEFTQEIPAFVGSTDTLSRQKAVLDDLEQLTFLEIIIGERPLSAFDDFVEEWNRLGGEQATAEVNEIMGE